MVAITVRNVPLELHEEMATRAARARRSLQEYILGLMEADAEFPPLDEVLDQIERRVLQSGSRLPVAAILAGLDEDRDDPRS
jgi:antitoxin FitA